MCARRWPRPNVGAPAELVAAIDRMAPMLRFFRHGDGGLALFNGTWEGDRRMIDLVLARYGLGRGGAGDGAGQRVSAAWLPAPRW